MTQKIVATSDYRSTPTAEYRFFLYDPNDGGMMFFKSAEVRDQIAEAGIRAYCDQDGWSEEVVNILAGEVTTRATKTDLEKKPERAEFDTDDDYEDAMAEWPGGSDFDETCNYKLLPLLPNSPS